MKKQEILRIVQTNAERISAIEKHLFGEQLEEAKQLEVGKWYWASEEARSDKSCLFNYQGLNSYGFNWECKWSDGLKSLPELGCRIEATPQEVKEALIEEAKKRGYNGKVISCIKGSIGASSCPLMIVDYDYNRAENELVASLKHCSYTLFSNGKWATIIEKDKFAELKEAHKNGAVIQWSRKNDNDPKIWKDCHENDPPTWAEFNEYRIKPEEKPKVGDVCKFWDANDNFSLSEGIMACLMITPFFLIR